MLKLNIAFYMDKWSTDVKRNEAAWRDAGLNLIIVWQCVLEGNKALRTLDRICAKVEFWAADCRLCKMKRSSHRFEIPNRRCAIKKAKGA